jgi:hypothetical protein
MWFKLIIKLARTISECGNPRKLFCFSLKWTTDNRPTWQLTNAPLPVEVSWQ